MNRFIEVSRLENGERILLNEADIAMVREVYTEDGKKVSYVHTNTFYQRGLAVRETYKQIIRVLGLKGVIKYDR